MSPFSSVQFEAHALLLRASYTFQYYNQLLYLLLLTITTSTSTRMHETPCRDFSQPGAIYWWTIQLPNDIAVYFSHKVPRHLAVSTHTSVIASCAFALWFADNHNNNGGIVTSPQHAQRGGSGAVQQCSLFGGAINR